MINKNYDNRFSSITASGTESIDLCLVLFSFLYSTKDAFKKAKEVFNIEQYRKFFKKLQFLGLFKNTKYESDKKYQDLISNFVNGTESEKDKDAVYFYNELEKTVTMHNKDAKRLMKKYIVVSVLAILFGIAQIVFTVGKIYVTKKFLLWKLCLDGVQGLMFIIIGGFILRKCILSLKVYNGKELNIEKRYINRDIDLDYCFTVLHREMKSVYNKMESMILSKENISQVQNLIDEIKDSISKNQDNTSILSALDQISEKLAPLKDVVNQVDQQKNQNAKIRNVDEMIEGRAPIKKVDGIVKCTTKIQTFINWLVDQNYDDEGLDSWLYENIKDKNGNSLKWNTIKRGITKARRRDKKKPKA